MADIAVLGAGLGGLQAAMLLAADGHRVTIVERDEQPPPARVEEAWGRWRRRGVTQFGYGHFLLPRWRELAEVELPTVVEALDDRGALRFNPFAEHPARRGPLRPEDARFDVVTARRPVIEMAMAAAATATPGVTIRRGVAVAGLAVGPGAPGADGPTPGVPHVTGLLTSAGPIEADLVVDCGGRRSSLPAWVAEAGGGPIVDDREDSGFVYYGRHYSSVDGSLPDGHGSLLNHHDSASVLTLPADNGTWSVIIVGAGDDAALRGLRDTAAWERAIALYPHAAHWATGKPLEDVKSMAALDDRIRRYVVDGRPAITGVVALADAWACTNPSLGRGVSIGLEHALCLRAVLREVGPDRPEELALRFDEATAAGVEPRFRQTLTVDRHRVRELQGDASGTPYAPDDPGFQVGKALTAAAAADDEVLRAHSSVAGLLATADEALSVPGVFESVIALGAEAPRYPLPGPDRAELLAAVAG